MGTCATTQNLRYPKFALSVFRLSFQETPIGEVIEGMENVENFYSQYGDGPPFGKGPAQGKIHSGSGYIEENFPKLDKFLHCKVERLNGEEEVEVGVNLSRKADGVTDEEEFQKAHFKSAQMGNQPHLGDDSLLVYGIVVASMILCVIVSMKKKKVSGKFN